MRHNIIFVYDWKKREAGFELLHGDIGSLAFGTEIRFPIGEFCVGGYEGTYIRQLQYGYIITNSMRQPTLADEIRKALKIR